MGDTYFSISELAFLYFLLMLSEITKHTKLHFFLSMDVQILKENLIVTQFIMPNLLPMLTLPQCCIKMIMKWLVILMVWSL